MFTGIVEAAGKIESIEHGPDGGRLRISLAGAPSIAAETKLGDSISVNGCCLTVVEFTSDHFSADLSGETLRRTSLGEKKPGDIINLGTPARCRRPPRQPLRARSRRWCRPRNAARSRR